MGTLFTFHTVATFLVALVLGGMVFFSFVMTPLVFLNLDKKAAGALLGNVFPTYFRMVAGVSVIAALLIWYRWEAGAMATVAAASVVAWLYILPPLERLRPDREAGDPVATSKFRRLHRISVGINLAQIAVVVIVFFQLVR